MQSFPNLCLYWLTVLIRTGECWYPNGAGDLGSLHGSPRLPSAVGLAPSPRAPARTGCGPRTRSDLHRPPEFGLGLGLKLHVHVDQHIIKRVSLIAAFAHTCILQEWLVPNTNRGSKSPSFCRVFSVFANTLQTNTKHDKSRSRVTRANHTQSSSPLSCR